MADFVVQNNYTKLDFAEIARQRGGSPNQYLNMEDGRWEQVKCPFCFKKFTPFRVHYRISKMNVASEMDQGGNSKPSMDAGSESGGMFGNNGGLFGNNGGGLFGSQNQETQAQAQSQADGYQTYDDDRLASFWAQYGQNKGKKSQPVMAVMPEVERKNLGSDEEPNWQDVPKPGFVQSWRVFVDRDGFPCGMEDPEKGAVSYERLCPECHNKLPFAYGKHPVKFIAVVGITKSGKTVYLSSLLDQFSVLIGNRTGLTTMVNNEEINKYVSDNKIGLDRNLPGATAVGQLIPPLPTIVQSGNQLTTLVFFDIAGENCVKADQMTQFGGFIRNADGIVMIVDPQQLADTFELPRDPERQGFSPEFVLQTMYQSFLAAEAGAGQKCRIPLAVAFSKSDLLRTYIKNNSEDYGADFIYDDIKYGEYTACQGRPGYLQGYAWEDGREVNLALEAMLNPRNAEAGGEDGKTFYKVVDNLFANRAFFAFTALSTNPTGKVLESAPMSVRIEQPLAWLFYKMGLIPAMYRDKNKEEIKVGLFKHEMVPKKSTFDPGAVRTINGGLKFMPGK